MTQNWQPMHFSLSIWMEPSSATCDASVGHTFTHSGFSQCWQLMGRKYMYTSGYCPDPPGMGFGPTRTTLFQ